MVVGSIVEVIRSGVIYDETNLQDDGILVLCDVSVVGYATEDIAGMKTKIFYFYHVFSFFSYLIDNNRNIFISNDTITNELRGFFFRILQELCKIKCYEVGNVDVCHKVCKQALFDVLCSFFSYLSLHIC